MAEVEPVKTAMLDDLDRPKLLDDDDVAASDEVELESEKSENVKQKMSSALMMTSSFQKEKMDISDMHAPNCSCFPPSRWIVWL